MKFNKISTIAKQPKPTIFREIQIFLGFANFYKRFIMGFLQIVRELTNILKGGIQKKFKEILITFIPKA